MQRYANIYKMEKNLTIFHDRCLLNEIPRDGLGVNQLCLHLLYEIFIQTTEKFSISYYGSLYAKS